MQRQRRLPHYTQQTRHVNPMPVQCWSTVAGSVHQPFNTGQCCWLWCVQAATIQCLLNFEPASPVLGSIHSALVNTSCWRYQYDALNQIWVNSICPYVFSYKMFVKSDFFVFSHLEHSSDEKKRDWIFF